MKINKPNKIGLFPLKKKSVATNKASTAPRPKNIWDDYSSTKSSNKKREYEKGAGNRMVPKDSGRRDLKKGEGELADENSTENDESQKYKPCTDYELIEERLEFKFTDRDLIARALTHRSALGLKERADYERLEFLGDAVLDLAVARLLSDRHPEAREGELSKMRAALVNTQALAAVAQSLDLGPFIKLGRGELASGGAERPSILADVMEAVIGAVYRDSSFDTSLEMIERIFDTSLDEVTPFDPKTELQEALHAAGSEPPQYLLELVEGPEHAPTFVTVVLVDGEIAGRGRGTTKKAAQQEAAACALARMHFDAPTLNLTGEQSVFLSTSLLSEQSEEPASGDTQEEAKAAA